MNQTYTTLPTSTLALSLTYSNSPSPTSQAGHYTLNTSSQLAYSMRKTSEKYSTSTSRTLKDKPMVSDLAVDESGHAPSVSNPQLTEEQ